MKMKKQIIIITIAFILCANANINAQTKLIYDGGVYQNDIKLKPKEVRELFKNDSVALSKYKSGRIFYVTGKCIFYPSVALTGLGLYILIDNEAKNGWTLRRAAGIAITVDGVLGMFIGYLIYNSGTNKMKQSVELYNGNLNSNKVSVNLGLTGNGVGLNVRF